MFKYPLILLSFLVIGCYQVNQVSDKATIQQTIKESYCSIVISKSDINSYGDAIDIYEDNRLIARVFTSTQNRYPSDTISIHEGSILTAKYLRSSFKVSLDTVAKCGMEWYIK
jgi:hypothetical protein